jgi:mono/diheme cytochrome c family protein
MFRRTTVISLILAIGVTFALTSIWDRIKPESSPIARGAKEKGVYACLTCHGRDDPALPDDWSLHCHQQTTRESHPSYQGQCKDLLAFFASVRVRNTFASRFAAGAPNRLLAGEHLARSFHCFQCHGELGQGGYPNNGALKGYIPGYFGEDFRRLTNNASRAAVESWIKNGLDPDLFDSMIEGPVARFFVKHQQIQMPKFHSLTEEQANLLIDYVLTLHTFGPMDAAVVRLYDQLSRTPAPANSK